MMGSMIMPAISSPRSANTCCAASRSLNGTLTIQSVVPGISPLVWGTDTGRSRGPASSCDGKTLTISASWCPWYVPSIFTTRSRPVDARMIRTASSVASVPEFPNRQNGSPVRSVSASATGSASSVGCAKCVPSATRFCTASTILGWAWPITITP